MRLFRKPRRWITVLFLFYNIFIVAAALGCGGYKELLYSYPPTVLAVLISYAWCVYIERKEQGEVIRKPIVLLKALWDLFLGLCWSFVAIVPVVIVLPAYSCYGDRAKMSEVILYGSSYRMQVIDYYKEHDTLEGVKASVEIDTREYRSKYVKFSHLFDDGTLLVFSEEPAGLVFLTPVMVGGKLEWDCTGRPLRNMPSSCRSERLFKPEEITPEK